MLDQDGHARAWSSLRGDALVVSFIYTRCPDATECPAVSAKFAEMQAHLPPHAHLVEVTLDPAFDRPIVLKRYGAIFGADPAKWTLFTGDPGTVLTFARRFGIAITTQNGRLVHGEAVAVMDARERLQSLTSGTSWQPDEVLAEVRNVNRQPSNVFERIALWFRNFGNACGAALNGIQAWARPFVVGAAIAIIAITGSVSIYLLRQLRF
jgi:protein SCO1/2